jgi:G3E family GTPase
MIAQDARKATFARTSNRVRRANPQMSIVPATQATIDQDLVFDITLHEDPFDELPLSTASRAEHDDARAPHANAVIVRWPEPADPGAVLHLLENQSANANRLKAHVKIRNDRGTQRFPINMV